MVIFEKKRGFFTVDPHQPAPSTSSLTRSRLIDMVLVHRCRFVEWVPSGIEALQLTPDGQWLAVARSDASIELWHSEPPTWHLEKVRPHSTAG